MILHFFYFLFPISAVRADRMFPDLYVTITSNSDYFIYFTLDPSTIDVNIHPTKTEIKFENEQPVWQILCASVKEALAKKSNIKLSKATKVKPTKKVVKAVKSKKNCN